MRKMLEDDNLFVSIYTDGDFYLTDKFGNKISNTLPHKYFIRIKDKKEVEEFAQMFYCNNFGVSNPDILTSLSIMIDDIRIKLLWILNNPKIEVDEDDLIFSNGNWSIQIYKNLKFYNLNNFK